uniref:Uncharacterized protein n=1 Tax=Aegilops tauschii TaxID=37682 RepID=R7W5C5_AEGTA
MDDTPNNIREFLEIDGIYVTTAQVSSHLQKYRKDCRTGGLSIMPSSMPSHSNSTSKNNLESQESGGSYRFHMRSQEARDINQTSWLSGGASQVDYGVLGNGNQTTNLGSGAAYGHGYHHGNGIGDINGYDHHYGTVSANDYVKGEIDCTKSCCISEIGVKSKPEDGDLVTNMEAYWMQPARDYYQF